MPAYSSKPFNRHIEAAKLTILQRNQFRSPCSAQNLVNEIACALQVCTMLLKKAVAKNYTPARIAAIMCREGSQKSYLEKIHSHAVQMCNHKGSEGEMDDATYLQYISEALDEVLVD